MPLVCCLVYVDGVLTGKEERGGGVVASALVSSVVCCSLERAVPLSLSTMVFSAESHSFAPRLWMSSLTFPCFIMFYFNARSLFSLSCQAHKFLCWQRSVGDTSLSLSFTIPCCPFSYQRNLRSCRLVLRNFSLLFFLSFTFLLLTRCCSGRVAGCCSCCRAAKEDSTGCR